MSKWMNLAGGLLLALLARGAAPAEAQRIDPNRIVDLHVNAEGENQSFDGSVPEGQRFRLTFAGRGTYELSPVLLNAATRTFRITVYAGAENAETGDLRLVERVDARQGVPVVIRSLSRFSVVIDGTRGRTASRPGQQARYQFSVNSAARRTLRPFFGSCCVRCGTVQACACRVVMECGECCADGCCPVPPAEEDPKLPPPGAMMLAPRPFAQLAGACAKPVRDEERLFTPRASRNVIASR